jgi:peptide chain release factor 1
VCSKESRKTGLCCKDRDLAELAREELDGLENELPKLEDELRLLLLPRIRTTQKRISRDKGRYGRR